MTARIAGLGAYRPANVVTNDDLAGRVETSDTWIVDRTGIRERRIANADETVASMAIAASGKALADAGVTGADVGLVLLATCTLPFAVPGAAATVADGLGATCGALDLNAGCAGFSYALALAADTVTAGTAQHVLVVASERLSDWVDWTDRATCVLFGDGAGAAIVSTTDERPGIGPVVWGSDGARHSAISIAAETRALRMDGPAVFRWATTELAEVARNACDAAGVEPAELAAFVPHQANMRIVDNLAARLGVDSARVARDGVHAGNTSAASIPLALCDLVETGRLSTGEPALLLGFGAGLTYSAQVVWCP